jgi:glycosyltransferase involved in cell wall biosynthesis
MPSEINVNDKYKLSPVYSVDKDDIQTYLRNGNGVYVCSFPDQKWHDHYGLKIERNYSIKKKQKMFDCLSNHSVLLSPTEIMKEVLTDHPIQDGRVLHLSSRFTKARLKQIEYAFNILRYVFKHRRSIDFVFYYNFEMPIFFTAWMIKRVLGKKIYVDFEDDYTLVSRNKYKNILSRLLFRIPDMVICINREMTKHFGKHTDCLVYNGFIDLSYSRNVDFTFKEDSTFLYAGSLDDIRGVDLLPEIVAKLKTVVGRFRVKVSGSGPLEAFVRNLAIPEIEFLGFLSEEDYARTLEQSDYFLVLQKPDHPFNRGSFPSKIEYYAALKKPIYSLKLVQDTLEVNTNG